MREKEKYELNKIIEDFEVQVNVYMVSTNKINEKNGNIVQLKSINNNASYC